MYKILILSRHVDESIRIGPINLTITSIRGNHARIGIQAPRCLPVFRTELLDAVPCDPKQLAKECLSLVAIQMNKPVEQHMIDFMADEVIRLIGGAE